jgi:Cu(I)/Ag(I) efflux system membrane protein CusA/SilA
MSGLLSWSSRHHRLVLGLALLLAGAGELARRSLSRDVIPDLSDPQIVLVADWMGHPATEVAGAVTSVLTRALGGLPGAVAIRGSSMPGMAYVDVVFGAPRQLSGGRAAILARVEQSRPMLPASVRVQIGPVASSTGWVFQYVVVDPTRRQSPLGLRNLQDDLLRPALAALPGVAEVASVGGAVQQVSVEVRLDELRANALAFTDVLAALPVASAVPLAATTEQLRSLPIAAGRQGHDPAERALRLGDVAYVRLANDMPAGQADLGGVLQAVGGIVTIARDADLASVVARVRRTLDEQRARLPGGVQIVVVHDRLTLVDRVGRTLLRALGEEIGVVALVIAIFLFSGRSALVPLMTLPLVLLLTFGAMWLLGVTATIMSLGGIGIALGMAVDVDVVALEACHRRLESLGAGAADRDRRAELVAAAAAFTPAILTSLVIAALTFLPVFAFTGETGRLLRPLALTKTLVIAAAAVVTLTFAPALRERLLRRPVRPELDNPLTRGLVRIYGPFVRFALARPSLTLLTATLAVVSCLPIVGKLGGEFLPRVDEGDLLFMPTTLPGVAPEQAVMQLRWQDRTIGAFQEVATVFGKVGRADTATDPAPYAMAETTIHLRPRSEWPELPRLRWYSGVASPTLRRILGLVWPEHGPSTTPELVERLDRATRLPGWTNAWTAPARARMDMMSTGFRTPVAVRIVAARPDRLDALGPLVRNRVLEIPGTRSAAFESLGGETRLELALDAAALSRQRVDPALARSTADLLLSGGQIGDIAQDGRRLRLRVLANTGAAAAQQGSGHVLPDQLRGVTVRASGGGGAGVPVPLALVGHPRYVTLPSVLRTERGQLVGYVFVDLTEGTDVRGYVQRAGRALDEAVAAGALPLGAGERLEWTGQSDLLAAGERRLKWIAPLVALSMLGLLFLQFRSLTEALIVLVAVPFALVGSVWALFLCGYPLSAPAWVGLLSVLGLAMQTGVVMVVYIDDAFHRRLREGRIGTRDDIVEAHAEGTVRRLRPKIMTVTTMAAALLPLLWADGAGAEIMKRVATPMIGGLVSSTFLTLEVLPVLYTIWRHRQLRRATRRGVPLATIVGRPPAWARR